MREVVQNGRLTTRAVVCPSDLGYSEQMHEIASEARLHAESVPDTSRLLRFWMVVTVLVSIVVAVVGVFAWQLGYGLLTGNWPISQALAIWGIALSLSLLLTIVAGVRYRLTPRR
ncbi:MAG: hypothetical protein NTW48_09580 [Chloroflexi bacterium]|nr:hypothetical protein [Chloroflexota bacterium]